MCRKYNNKLNLTLLKYQDVLSKFDIIGEFKGIKHSYNFKCKKCGNVFMAYFKSKFCIETSKALCPYCEGAKNSKLTKDIINFKLKNTPYILNETYTGSKKCHDIYCDIHKTSSKVSSINDLLMSKTVPECCKTRIPLTDDRITKILQSKNISLIDLSNRKEDILTVKCNKCDHIWKPSIPNILYAPYGCPMCNRFLNEKLTGIYLAEICKIQPQSHYEIKEKIFHKNILIKNNIYVDFYISNSKPIIVEYNGIQHYESTKFSYCMSQEEAEYNLFKQKIRDRWLRKYCKIHNIYLIEIDGRKYQRNQIKNFLIAKFNKLNISFK